MSPLLQVMLSAHVILGIVGIIAFYAVLIGVLKRTPSLTFLRASSVVSFLSIVASWFSGGYYYVVHYGGAVKPIIKGGDFPWAHLVFMEAKEHAFLILPFVALVLVLIFYLIGDRVFTEPKLKSSVVLLAAVATIIGTLIAIAGMIVTGGAQ